MDSNPFELLINGVSGLDAGFLSSGGAVLTLQILEFIALATSLFFFFHSIYLVYSIVRVKGRFQLYKDAFTRKTPPSYRGEFVTRWIRIKQRMETMQESEYKLAILEADKIFDDLLKKMMVRGKDMAGRLKQINSDLLPSIEKVWHSHKVRNKIAHKPDFHLTYKEAEGVIENFEAALKELRILD